MANILQQIQPSLQTKEITDIHIRRNFENLTDYFKNQNQLLGFKFFDLSFSGAVTNFKQAHGLKYAPEDVIVTKITGPGTVSFNHGFFNTQTIDLTVTDACRIRFFVGTYWNLTNNITAQKTDISDYFAQLTGGGNAVVQSTTGDSNLITVKLMGPNSVYQMPSAKGLLGTRYRFIHLGTSHINQYKILPVSPETLNANGATSLTMFTRSEVFEFESDDSVWMTMAHKTSTEFEKLVMLPLLSAGWGSVTNDSGLCKRRDDELVIRASFSVTSPAATVASFILPYGYKLDPKKIPGNGRDFLGRIFRMRSNSGFTDNWCWYDNATLDRIFFASTAVNAGTIPNKDNGTTNFGSGDGVIFYDLTLPVAGWTAL